MPLFRSTAATMLLLLVAGCSQTARDLALDADLARSSLEKALQAWVDGKQPAELQPEITVGDTSWSAGAKLVKFEVRHADERNDGTNLYVPVVCTIRDAKGKESKTETIYVVGTSPKITIFPQSI